MIPDDIRIQTYLRFSSHPTLLEAYCYTNACQLGDMYGIPVWKYNNGALLFETEKPEAHIKEFLQSYLDLANYVESCLQIPGIDPAKIPELKEHDIEGKCEFGSWHNAYLDELGKSKRIFEERSEPEGTFIQCRKCKSNAVDTEQKQTRSADEPMTIFCMCRKCGTRFTMH